MTTAFEGSYLGDASKLSQHTALECGICWHLYDPAVGDDVAQVPPGTPFAALPDTWRCPNCDAPKQKFLALGDVGDAASQEAAQGVVHAYRQIAAVMNGLPIYHPLLIIEAVGFRRHDGRLVGVMITPWFMNITLLPRESDAANWRAGQTLMLAFPSGQYEFAISELPGAGLIASCSLMSPMNDFTDHEAARLAAMAAIEGLFQPDAAAEQPRAEPSPSAPQPSPLTRRAMLGVPE